MRRLARRINSGTVALLVTVVLASCSAPSTTVHVASFSHSFTPSELHVAAGEAFRLEYSNMDGTAQHNVAVYTRQGGDPIAISESIVGPASITSVTLPALRPGRYYFQCDIHPFMNGALVAGSGEPSSD